MLWFIIVFFWKNCKKSFVLVFSKIIFDNKIFNILGLNLKIWKKIGVIRDKESKDK